MTLRTIQRIGCVVGLVCLVFASNALAQSNEVDVVVPVVENDPAPVTNDPAPQADDADVTPLPVVQADDAPAVDEPDAASSDDAGPSAEDLFDDDIPSVEPDADEPEGSQEEVSVVEDIVAPSLLPESDDDNDARLVGQDGEQAVPMTDSQADRERQEAEGEGPKPPPLPEPYTSLHNQPCTIQLDPATQWVLVIFQAKEGEDRVPPPCWVLPNALLEEMEETAALKPETVFRVTGENTTYDNRPFFIIRKAGTEGRFDPRQNDEDKPANDEPGEDGAAPGELTSDDVMDQLLDEDPAAPIIAPADEAYEDREQPEGVSPEIEDQDVEHPGRGQMVVDREIVILPTGEGKWREAVFAGDNHGHEPPLRLLPCRLLTDADRACAERPRESLRFSVTGEIVEYKGQRYMLLTKLLQLRDMDQF